MTTYLGGKKELLTDYLAKTVIRVSFVYLDMAKEYDNPTADDEEEQTSTNPLNRRKVLQIGGAGLAIGTFGAIKTSAEADSLPNTIIFDGSESAESAAYEFLVSDTADHHPDLGTSTDNGSINGGHVTGEVGAEEHAYKFEGTLSYLDVSGSATVSILYGNDGAPETDRLEIVAASDGEVEYEITTSDPVTKVLDNGDFSADVGEDSIEEDDGTWTVIGSTENGYGDTYDFHGEIEQFEPVTGEFTLFFNGEETTVTDLTGQEPPDEGDDSDESEDESPAERTHSYSFEATGDEYVDYYLEVEEGGDLIPSTINDSVVEEDYHWINDDGTKAAGRVQPGDRHTYAFDTLVADVTIEGEAEARVNGAPSNLDQYPRDVAAGDYWKGYFPWQIADEERTHRYSFEATGDEYVDYYLEVEDGGDLIPSTADDAVIEYEFFWIGDDGTKAAGRVHPGDSHTYEFDTLVADVTIEGDAEATVNGNSSNLHIYPQDSASGDHWKTGFPWQDDGHEAPGNGDSDVDVGIRHGLYDGPLGGGDGISSRLVYDRSGADIVVTNGNVDAALSNASPGDVIYVEGSASGFTADVPDVTIAGNRGVGNDGRITGEVTVTADDVVLNGLTIRPGGGTALTIRAQWSVFYNCAFVNASNNAIQVRRRNTAATFTQCRFHNWSGYGFHHSYDAHDEEHKIVIEYSEFSDLGRHGISAGNAWYHIRDCHMHGSIGLDPDHFIEVRAPNSYGVNGSAPVECGAPCGNAIIEHNLHEMSGGSQKTRLIVVRGEPTDGVWVENNRSPGNASPSGGCWQNGTHGGWGTQLVMQNASSSDGFSSVTIENNEL